jgi:hypothetical protein
MAIQRGSTWQANIRLLDGSRLRPGGFATQAAAELWEAQARHADAQGLKPPPVDTARRSLAAKVEGAITIGQLRKRVMLAPYRDGWAGSKDEDNAGIRSFQVVKFYGENKRVADIDINEVEGSTVVIFEFGFDNDSNAGIQFNESLDNQKKLIQYWRARKIQVLHIFPCSHESQYAKCKQGTAVWDDLDKSVGTITVYVPQTAADAGPGGHPSAAYYSKMATALVAPVKELMARAGGGR